MASPIRMSSADNLTAFLPTNKTARTNTKPEETRGGGSILKSLLTRTSRQALSEVANSNARFAAFSSSSAGKAKSNELSPIKGTVCQVLPEARSGKAETGLNSYAHPAPALSEHAHEQMSSWNTEGLAEEIEAMTLHDESDDYLASQSSFGVPVQLDNTDCESPPLSPPELLVPGPVELDTEASPNWNDYLVDAVEPCLDVSLDSFYSEDDAELVESDEEIENMFLEDDEEAPLPKEFETNDKELDALRNIRTFFYCKAPSSPPTPPCLSPPPIPAFVAYEG